MMPAPKPITIVGGGLAIKQHRVRILPIGVQTLSHAQQESPVPGPQVRQAPGHLLVARRPQRPLHDPGVAHPGIYAQQIIARPNGPAVGRRQLI